MAVSVKLAADLDRRLRALARQRNSSHHYMMCEAIRRFVEDEEARMQNEPQPLATGRDQADEPVLQTRLHLFDKRNRPYRAPAE